MNNQDRIDELLKKIEVLDGVHSHFKEEIDALKKELEALRKAEPEAATPEVKEKLARPVAPPSAPEVEEKVSPAPARERLSRNQEKKILGGVCAGMAGHYGINLLLMRFLWVLFTVFFCVGALVYAILWATLPKSWGTPEVIPAPSAPEQKPPVPQPTAAAPIAGSPEIKANLERYIGENLIAKIGIAVLVIGAGIGVKYSIDNDLISPLVRILLGYTLGIGLGVIAFRLRPKYENFSAVLLSGSMAILYFMTFAACSFYDMLSPVTAFALMVFITVSTVVAALNYDRQFIAHIGLVGAYAVPFLLSEGKGQAEVLFTYMAIINAGILAVSLKKYWKPLYWVAFALTWLIVLTWYDLSYEADTHFNLAFAFGFVFFLLFYLTFLGYKLLQKEPFEVTDIVLVLINSFVFYGLGYDLLSDLFNYELPFMSDSPEYENSLGLFTLYNALLHGVVAFLVFRRRGADKPIFFLVFGLMLVFLTLTIPVQLDGSWVSLLWLGEGALLFWIGRTQAKAIYEKIAYPLLLLAFFSLLMDWDNAYHAGWPFGETERFPSLLNINFLSSMLFVVVLAYLNVLHYSGKHIPALGRESSGNRLVSLGISGLLLVGLYFAFYNELSYYWEGRYLASAGDADPDSFGREYNYDLKLLQDLWEMMYYLGFTALLLWVNTGRIRNQVLGMLGIFMAAFGLMFFLTLGLYNLSELRENILADDYGILEPTGRYVLWLRYLVYGFAGGMLFIARKQLQQSFDRSRCQLPFELALSVTILWTASSELLHWMDMGGAQEQYKLALTIFWGVFALGLSAYGIWKRKKHLRIAAMVLFGVTLLKLFFYDLADLPTLSKAIVFLALGVLLLLLSFLYNKFKNAIED